MLAAAGDLLALGALGLLVWAAWVWLARLRMPEEEDLGVAIRELARRRLRGRAFPTGNVRLIPPPRGSTWTGFPGQEQGATYTHEVIGPREGVRMPEEPDLHELPPIPLALLGVPDPETMTEDEYYATTPGPLDEERE